MFAVGTDKSFLFKEEDNWGVVPSQDEATNLRRVNASFDVVTELYTSNEVCVSTQEPIVDSTLSLLHFNSLPFTDDVGNSISDFGNVTYSSNTIAFNGSMDNTNTSVGSGIRIIPSKPFNIGTGDYTVECFVSLSSSPNPYNVVWHIGAYGFDHGHFLEIDVVGSTANLYFFKLTPFSGAMCSSSISLSSITYPNSLHIACCRSSGLSMLYVNGVLESSATDSTDISSPQRIRAGTMNYFSGLDDNLSIYQLKGYIDELRISKEAIYTSNFTVPNSEFVYNSRPYLSSANMQIRQVKRGLRNAKGSIKAELSAGTYAKLITNTLASSYSHGVDILDLSIKVEQNLSDNTTYDITRQSGSWVVDGFTAGTVVRLDGTLLNINNKLNNLYICSLTETVLTVYPLNAFEITTQSVFVYPSRCYVVGSISYAKKTNQIDKSFSFEECDNKLGISELYSGNKVKSFEVNTDVKSGLPTIDFELLGRDLVRKESTQYFDDTPYSATQTVSPACTKAFIDSSLLGVITGLTLRVERELQPNHIVGSKQSIDISENMLSVSGSFTAYFKDASIKQKYYNEITCSLAFVFTESLAKDASFIAFCLPRVMLKSKRKNDNAGMLYDTYEFTAVLNSDNNKYLKTIISIQDSEVEGE